MISLLFPPSSASPFKATDSDFEGFDGEQRPPSSGGARSAADKELALLEHRLSGQVKGATMVSGPMMPSQICCVFSRWREGTVGRVLYPWRRDIVRFSSSWTETQLSFGDGLFPHALLSLFEFPCHFLVILRLRS